MKHKWHYKIQVRKTPRSAWEDLPGYKYDNQEDALMALRKLEKNGGAYNIVPYLP